jgi:hypothetical protein
MGKVMANLRGPQLHTFRMRQSRRRTVIVAKGTQSATTGSGHGGRRLAQ